jgi:hypothetical protein
MYKINNIPLTNYGIQPSFVQGEGIAMKGIFDLPKRIGDTDYSWAEENSLEPYVDADEIFLEARALEFAGIMLGTKFEVQNNLAQFKTLVDGFTDLVLFETPYGSFSVQVKNIIAKQLHGVTSIRIMLSELEKGLIVTPLPPPTVYQSAAYSETAIKNNCDTGSSGTEVTLTADEGKFTSTLSQAAADQLAINWVRENKQDYANVNGSCTLDPVVYWNDKQAGKLRRNNCGFNKEGSVVGYTVEAFTYSSLISKADANQKAIDEIDANLTQQYANENGSCSLIYFYQLNNTVTGDTRVYEFVVASSFPVGTKFIIIIYGVVLSYTSVNNDSYTDVIDALVLLINGTTASEWRAEGQAPLLSSTEPFPPVAENKPPQNSPFQVSFSDNTLKVTMNASNVAIIDFE